MLNRLRALFSAILVFGALALGGVGLARLMQPQGPASSAMRTAQAVKPSSPAIAPPPSSQPASPPLVAPTPPSAVVDCAAPAEWRAAALANAAQSLVTPVSPFGVPEAGWAVYAPLIGWEIGSACPEASPAFAAALSRWQAAHAVAASGMVDAPTLKAFSALWLLRRPFVQASRRGCPASATTLASAAPAESYGGKAILARPAALAAYRRMVAAARAAAIAPPLLEIASAYRGPDEEAARCADGGCGTARKAHCSAHRTGLAFDLDLGAAPGADPFSTDDANRLYQSRTAAYRWLVANADRFGFTPYPFEPWHWEWTGQPV